MSLIFLIIPFILFERSLIKEDPKIKNYVWYLRGFFAIILLLVFLIPKPHADPKSPKHPYVSPEESIYFQQKGDHNVTTTK